MKLRNVAGPALAAALVLSAGAAFAQGYPQQQQQQYPQQNYPQQQQQGYPQQRQQGYPQQQQPGYQQPGYPQQQPGYGQPGYQDRDHGGWDRVPDEYQSDVQRQGFRDGMMGARQDFESRRQPSAGNRNEFRHPPVPRRVRQQYKDGYLRGYDVAMRHMMERRDDHQDGDRRDGDHHDDHRDDHREGYQPR